jgi:hypothetical protein
MPLLSSLAHHLPPPSYPLLPILRLFSNLLVSSLSSPSSTPSLVKDSSIIAYIVSRAVTVPDIYPVGHPARAIALAELGKLLLIPVEAPQARAPSRKGKERALDLPDEADDEGESSLVPIELRREAVEIPEEPVRRLVWAREVLMQALGEIRIGFGKGGGLVGKELEGLAEGVGREIGALRSAAGGRIAI